VNSKYVFFVDDGEGGGIYFGFWNTKSEATEAMEKHLEAFWIGADAYVYAVNVMNP
jgi:hypothetical protein